MGADLIIAHIWTTKSDSELNWDAVGEAIEALTLDDIEDEYVFAPNVGIEGDSDEEFLQRSVRPQVRLDIEEFRKLWTSEAEHRDTALCYLGPVRALITGGMSWGDDPTDTFTLLNSLPAKVLTAIGFLDAHR